MRGYRPTARASTRPRPARQRRLLLTILGGLAEFERELIRARKGEGRARAKAKGVRMGRKPKLTSSKPLPAGLHPSDSGQGGRVPAVFERRKRTCAENKRTGIYNISQKVDKLGLNGLSGKVAQSIGGSETKPPTCYNVFYAGAIRAGTRRAIGEAGLQAPHEVVQFCTDAVFSRVPLKCWSLVNQEAARCHELVPTAPNRPDDFYAPMRELSRWHKPKWYEGETELENDWAMEEDYESEEIAMGDQ